MNIPTNLDAFVDNHLNLQVKISYSDHHGFLLRHGLDECAQVLDVGAGNGTFVARLAQDHPRMKFTGIDKRKHCVESSSKLIGENLSFELVDMFSRTSSFDFSRFDGFLMRYFLLHVDNAHKILELLKAKSKSTAKFWIIDLDWSQITCEPSHPTFDKLVGLVKAFCVKVSVGSRGGQNIVPLLKKAGFQNIIVENIPFNGKNITIDDFTRYLMQEIQCYSIMSGKVSDDPETLEILRFIDEDVRSGKAQVSYGMVLVSAQLNE